MDNESPENRKNTKKSDFVLIEEIKDKKLVFWC